MRSSQYLGSPSIEISAVSGKREVRNWMILSTVPGMTVLGCCETLAVSDSISAILADFDMRGSANSALMLAGIALPNFLLRFFMSLFLSVVLRPLNEPHDQTNDQQSSKQSVSKHGVSFFDSASFFKG